VSPLLLNNGLGEKLFEKRMITEESIRTLIDTALEGTDKYLLDLTIKTGNNIHIFIEGDRTINIDDCVEVSRLVEGSLDREVEDFELHVSSAGIDQPLRLPRQFRKNVNRDLSIELAEKVIMKGTLLVAGDTNITIKPYPSKRKKDPVIESMEIAYSDIVKALIIIKF
jgi:ribosome maturation factor RimP